MTPFGGEDAESYYDEGLTASVRGDLARAIACFEQAIALDDTLLAARHQLAKCYLRGGVVERAAAMLRQVVAAKPDLVPAKLDLGNALLDLGHLQDARKQFADVVERQAHNVRANLGLAKVCFMEGNWSGAVALALDARGHGGDSFVALFLLGRAARLTGDTAQSDRALDEADALLEKSIESNPRQPEGYYLRGELRFVREQFAAAMEYYRAAGQWTEAGKPYAAFGEQFTKPDVLAKQGLCLQRMGEVALAREMGNRIVQLDPGHKIGQALAALQ